VTALDGIFHEISHETWQFRQNWPESHAQKPVRGADAWFFISHFHWVIRLFATLSRFTKMPRSHPIHATIKREKELIQSVVGSEQRPSSKVAQRWEKPEHHLERDKTMKFLNIFKAFKNDESGAVTVDWVVLTAAIVGLGMVVMQTVGGGIEDLGDTVVADLQGRESGYTAAP
jgi:Flp pilus assembly pilin Flp